MLDLNGALRMDTDGGEIRKALDTSGGTTGAVLVPEVIDAGVRMFVETRSPIWNIIRKFSFDGYAFAYREQNGLPVASFGAELGALPAAQNSTYVERSVPIKSIYIRGEISGQLIEASRSLLNVVEREINNSALGMVRTLEQKIIAGDSSSAPNEFDGLNKWITTTLNVDTVGNGTGTDQELSLAFLDQLIDLPAGGPPTHLIMSKAMRRKLWSVLQPQVRYMDTTTVAGGFQVPTYGGLPIIDLFDNGTILADTILAPDMDLVYMPILKPLTYEELAHTRDSIDYFLKMYLTVVVEGAARYHAKMKDVSSVIS
jgi:hypothetical protein